MTEPNERITALETNMQYVLSILAKREEYQNSVLVKLTTIELKQDQALLYQKTCDAERTAHAARIGHVENTQGPLAELPATLTAHAARIAALERHGLQGRTALSVLLKLVNYAGGIAAFAVSLVALVRSP